MTQSLNLEDNFKGHQFSLDALLDTFILLYDECSNSSLRREKSVSDFLKLGLFFIIIIPLNFFFYLFNMFCSETICSHSQETSINAWWFWNIKNYWTWSIWRSLCSSYDFLRKYICNENIKQMGDAKKSGNSMFPRRKRCACTWRSSVDNKLALRLSG